jgi:UPF0755 protein
MKKRHLETSIFGDPEHDHDEPRGRASAGDPASADGDAPLRGRGESRRAHRDSRRAHRRKKGRRRIIVLLVALSLVAGAAAAAILVLRPFMSSVSVSNDYVGAGSGAVTVVVHPGDAGRTIAAALEKAGVVKSAKAFVDVSEKDPRAASIQPGTYTLHAHMSAAASLAMLLDPANRKVQRVTIREGLWVSEIIHDLSASTGRPLADYTLALEDPVMLGLPTAAMGSAEGYLFPSTYEFDASVTAADQLHAMVAKSLDELGKLGVTPARMQRVLTIASIVEAEAKANADRPKVARVIENRLAIQMPLQMDSTVHFISHRRGKAGTTDAERLSKSPYNTYLVAGLPPGPIDSPGLSAMKAAVSPTPGPWLYFVAVNPETGETRFAVGPDGHAANVQLFQKWCSDHPGKC